MAKNSALDEIRQYLRETDLATESRDKTASHFRMTRDKFTELLRYCHTSWRAEVCRERMRRFEAETAGKAIASGSYYQEILGFTEPTNFYSFFKRWKGVNFGDWARLQRDK